MNENARRYSLHRFSIALIIAGQASSLAPEVQRLLKPLLGAANAKPNLPLRKRHTLLPTHPLHIHTNPNVDSDGFQVPPKRLTSKNP